MFDIPTRPTCVHHFVQENTEALQNAALLLGGPSWLKRLQRLFETLWSENSINRCVGHEITALHNLLALADVHDPSCPEAAYFAALDPSAPHVEEISLLADELRQAFEESCADQHPCEDDKENAND
jgi:hypothetical protein